jgi:hypothetical protein
LGRTGSCGGKLSLKASCGRIIPFIANKLSRSLVSFSRLQTDGLTLARCKAASQPKPWGHTRKSAQYERSIYLLTWRVSFCRFPTVRGANRIEWRGVVAQTQCLLQQDHYGEKVIVPNRADRTPLNQVRAPKHNTPRLSVAT